MKTIVITLFTLSLLACQSSRPASTQTETAVNIPEDRIDQLVKDYLDLDIFSGVVLIAHEGKPIYHKAFGLANRATNTPNTLETKFDIGSMNKSFTKVVIMQLHGEGKLDLDDPLGKHLDGFPPEVAQKVTIRQLLSHSSGFGDYISPGFFELPDAQRSIQAITDRLRRQPLQFEPGTDRAYSNAGYVILGAVIEAVTGESYYDQVEKRITRPLGMKDTYLRSKRDVPQRSIGYLKTMRGELESNEEMLTPPTSAGGFYSTTEDMLKFYQAFHYGDKLWDEALKQQDDFFKFTKMHQDDGKAIAHAGGFNGANTVLFENQRDRLSILVFANMDEPVAEQLGDGILALTRGQEPKPPALPAFQSIYQSYREHGIAYVKKNFEELTRNFHPSDPRDMILNDIGYNLMFSNDLDAALEIFQLNTELFPDIANTWDSLGEAWLNKGDKEKALTYYRKALSINPDMPSAKEAVARLEKE